MAARWRIPLALLAVVVCAATAAAQSNQGNTTAGRGSSSGRGTSASSMFGNRTLGGGIQSNAQTQAGGAAQPTLEQAAQGAGGLDGSERFLRENRQGAFVGADTGDATNVRSQVGGTGQQNLGNLFQNLFENRNLANETGRSNTQLRIPIRLGFAPGPIATAPVTTAFTIRLTRLPEFHARGPIVVTMRGRTAVLEGVVASEADRQLAEDLAMLEPAVRDVDNDLVVDQAATTEEIPVQQSPAGLR